MSKMAILAMAASFGLAQMVLTSEAEAVGAGQMFDVDESKVPDANFNAFQANSLDFTYHGCVNFTAMGVFTERGYFWLSSYQNQNSVIDSQLNSDDGLGGINGYRIYGFYQYDAGQFGASQPTPSGNRFNYVVANNNAQLSLFLDVKQNTIIGNLPNCLQIFAGNSDDIFLGESVTVGQGEKSETNGLAHGDFKVIFTNWAWDAAAIENPIYSATGFAFNNLIFNGNITRLQGPLVNDHNPEGSGNLFWRD
jgi:hypothetical protein